MILSEAAWGGKDRVPKFQPSPAFVQLSCGHRGGRRCGNNSQRELLVRELSKWPVFGGGSVILEKVTKTTKLLVRKKSQMPQSSLTLMFIFQGNHYAVIDWIWKSVDFWDFDYWRRWLVIAIQMRWISAGDHWSAATRQDARGVNGGQVGEHMGHLACHQLAWDQSKPQQLLLDPLNFLSKLRMTRLVWGCVAWVEISCMEKPSRRWASTKRFFQLFFSRVCDLWN